MAAPVAQVVSGGVNDTVRSVLVAATGEDGSPGAASAPVAQSASSGSPGARADGRRQRSRPAFERRWKEPLRGAKLRRLRERLLDHWNCAGLLSRAQRRALVLRAGLFGRTPATRTSIARKLEVPLRRTQRLERTGIRRLVRAGTCIDTGGAAAGASVYPAAPGDVVGELGVPGSNTSDGRRDREEGAVLGVEETRVMPDLGQLREPETVGGGVPLALVAGLVVMLALLGTAALAVRRADLPPPMLLAQKLRRSSAKPLLFLDVDGVIALWPFEEGLPPHRSHEFGYTQVLVADRCGELVRTLERHFEIVLATGWGGRVTRALVRILQLEREPRALKFGTAARGGSSDWKIATIERAAGGRPLAWVDDAIGPRHEEWAADREQPTFLVKPDRSTGLAEEHVRKLLRWAESLEATREGRFSRRAPREALRR